MNRMLAKTLSLSAVALALMGNASAQTLVQTPNPVPSAVTMAIVGFQDADTLYNQGVDAFGKNDFAGAIAKFQAAIAKRPSFTDAHFNLGVSFSAAGKPTEAVTEFTWIVNKMPPAPKGKLADSLHERGRCYNALKQPDKALADFQQALTLKPDMVDVLLDRASAYFSAQQYDKAIADFSQYLTANPKADPVVLNNRGLAYMAKFGASKAEADARAAIADFDKYITANPTQNVDGYLGKADAEVALGLNDKAVADYTAFLAKNPTDAYALGARARANMALKSFKAAVDDYTKLVAAAPTDPNAKVNLGIAQFQAGDAKGAITTLNGAVGNPPKASDKVALSARAQAYVAAKDWANATKDYDAILKIDPNEQTAYFNRAVASSNLDAYDKAVADFQTYLKSSPKETAPAYLGIGTAYLHLKKYPEAVESFTKFITANPKDPIGLYNRGASYYNIAIGNKDKAAAGKGIDDLNAYLKTSPTDKKNIADANKLISELSPIAGVDPKASLDAAIAANPTDPDPRVNRGVYFLQQNPPQYDKAIADFTAAAAVAPKDATILYNRAIAFQGKKDWPSVIKDTTAALAIKADYADALVTRADANYSAKAYPAAIADYKQFVTLSKEDKDKAYGLTHWANASVANKDFTTAVDAMTQFITALPKDPTGYLRRGQYYLQLKKNDEAIKDLTDYLSKPAAPDQKPEEATAYKASAYLARGLAYVNKDDSEKAAADFEQAYATKADVISATQGAQAYAKVGAKLLDSDPKAAATAYGKAVAMYDKAVAAGGAKATRELADAYYNKGVVLEAKYKADEQVDNLKLAVEAYTKYIETGKQLTPPATDAADVQKHVDELKQKIAEA